MITWMITRTGFAMLWPDSELPLIRQPLGGELLFTRPGRRSPRRPMMPVQAQSDWGIDTLYTFATVRNGFSVFETYVPQGKIHKLYGSLTDIRTMVIECFAAMQSLQGTPGAGSDAPRDRRAGRGSGRHQGQGGVRPRRAPCKLLAADWTPQQEDLLALFPAAVRDGMLAARTYPRFSFMDDRIWFDDLLGSCWTGSCEDDADWEALLFRLWIARVLQYTVSEALRGYDHALAHLDADGRFVPAMRQ